MKPQEAEKQARELFDSFVYGKIDGDTFRKELTNLIIKAGERVILQRSVIQIGLPHYLSLGVTINPETGKLENKLVKELASIREKLELAQADCAVKQIALEDIYHSSMMRSEPYIPRDTRTHIEEICRKALKLNEKAD